MKHDKWTTRFVQSAADPSGSHTAAEESQTQRVARGDASGVHRFPTASERLFLSKKQAYLHAAAASELSDSQDAQEAELSRHHRIAGSQRRIACGSGSGGSCSGSHDAAGV